MIEIIAGEKGKGKTKVLLDKVNEAVKTVGGNIVYLDKSQKHMYELDNKVRLVNVADFPISNCDEFHEMYLDSFLTISGMKDEEFTHAIEKLDVISEKYKVKFILSISMDASKLPECAKAKVVAAL